MGHSIAMNVRVKNARGLNYVNSGAPPQLIKRSADKFVRLAQLRKLRDCEQVAAVCYRVRDGRMEFLLVRTRGQRRWIFPKGGAEPGLTHAQAAALEAFEEAGVHGRIEEAPFAQYVLRKVVHAKKPARSLKNEIVINAHLCEVLRLSAPKESKRDRTWFSADDARLRLRERRDRSEGNRLSGVIAKAEARIHGMGKRFDAGRDRAKSDRVDVIGEEVRLRHVRPQWHTGSSDPLNKVQFDFAETYGPTVFAAPVRRLLNQARHPEGAVIADSPRSSRLRALGSRILPFEPSGVVRKSRWLAERTKMKALGNGAQNG
jgi:8-oxo-dGTP pyrophosphatase MutT (NUDIX family)